MIKNVLIFHKLTFFYYIKFSHPSYLNLAAIHKFSMCFRVTDCGTSGSSNPDSGPNSPGAAIREEGEPDSSEGRPGRAAGAQDLQLFSSPSLPNISLGRPHVPTTVRKLF